MPVAGATETTLTRPWLTVDANKAQNAKKVLHRLPQIAGFAQSRPAALKAVAQNAQPPADQALTDTAELLWRIHWWKAVQNDPALADVLTAWPSLPGPIRAGILAMIESVRTEG